MIRATFLLAEGAPPYRVLWEGDLPAIPLPGEPLAFDGRIYRVEERSWRFGYDRSAPIIPPNTQPPLVMGCGVALTQIGGPPHVLVR